jgi:hypothetical protein
VLVSSSQEASADKWLSLNDVAEGSLHVATSEAIQENAKSSGSVRGVMADCFHSFFLIPPREVHDWRSVDGTVILTLIGETRQPLTKGKKYQLKAI